jgi:YggT family protein
MSCGRSGAGDTEALPWGGTFPMPIIAALLFVFNSLISLVIAIVIVNAVISWLIAFDVLNIRNGTVYRIVSTLDSLTEPMLRPLRRVLPNLGGIDISPILLIILLKALQILVNGFLAPGAGYL